MGNNSKRDTLISSANTLFLLSVIIFPQHIKYFSVLTVLFLLIYCLAKNVKFVIDENVFLWVAYIVFGFITSVFSPYVVFNNLLETTVGFSISLIMCMLQLSTKACRLQIRQLFILAFVVLVGACLQVVTPDLICNFNRLHLDAMKYNIFYNDFFRGGFLTGITFQTAITAYYCSILAIISVCYFLSFYSNLEKWKKLLLLVVSLLSLVVIFFTSKRSFILYSLLLIIFLCCFYYRKHIVKILLFIIPIGLGLYYLFTNTRAGQRMIERSQGDDITSNRALLSKKMFMFFKESPIIGKGVSSTLVLIPDFTNGHNIYLQLLSETGIIGFAIAISFFIKNIITVFQLLLRTNSLNDRYTYSCCFCLQILFLLWGITGNPLYDVYPLYVYMICVGIVWNTQRYSIKHNS